MCVCLSVCACFSIFCVTMICYHMHQTPRANLERAELGLSIYVFTNDYVVAMSIVQYNSHAHNIYSTFCDCFSSQETWSKSLESLSQQRRYDITFTESQLNGSERFVADNVATKDDCGVLVELIHVGRIGVCVERSDGVM